MFIMHLCIYVTGPWPTLMHNCTYIVHLLTLIVRVRMYIADPCGVNPCQNEGQCVESADGGFACHCKLYYVGEVCEEKISKYKST